MTIAVSGASFVSFITGVAIISLSGVIAPGPITAVAIGEGNKTPYAGTLIALGHGIVELPLMIAIYFGLGYLINIVYVKTAVFLLGGLLLLIMAAGMLRSLSAETDFASYKGSRSPNLSGIILSIGNPYFLVWWATVGASLIMNASGFGIKGFLLLAAVHWSCDFLWLFFLSALSFKGGRFFGLKFQKIIFLFCSGFLLIFGGIFIVNGLNLLS